jgi:hypothetical protein
MPQEPIPAAFAAILRSDAVAALAAAFIVATSHADVFSWVAKTIGSFEPPRSNGGGRPPKRSNGHGGPRTDARTAKRDADDGALIEAMRSDPEGLIRDWAATICKSRTSCFSALHRLRAAGLAESVEGKWRLVEESAPREPPPRWVAPLKAKDRAAHVHLTAS